MSTICPECNGDDIACFDCGLYIDTCDCGSDLAFCYMCQKDFSKEENMQFPDVDWEQFDQEAACNCNPEATYICAVCRVHRANTFSPWKRMDDPVTEKSTAPKSEHKTTASEFPSTPKKCRHYHEAVQLDNCVIHCSSHNSDRKGGGEESPVPDFGLYADYCWTPTWQSVLIHWPDFNIPKHHGTGAEMIALAYQHAVNGSDVEIGCIGGHGRTGTILACMKVYDTKGAMSAEDAIKWVKETYCTKAVETESQEWYVAYFSNYWFDTPLPEPKEKPKSSSSSSSSSSSIPSLSSVGKSCKRPDHFAMIMRGHKTCYAKGECKYWVSDVQTFEKGISKSSFEYTSAAKLMENYPLRYGGEKLEQDKTDTHIAEMHAAMYEKGHRECALLGPDCGYWDEDMQKFETGNFKDVDKKEAAKWLPDFPRIEH